MRDPLKAKKHNAVLFGCPALWAGLIAFLSLMIPTELPATEFYGDARYSIGIGRWFSDADSFWEISDVGFRSRLDFKNTASEMMTIEASVGIIDRLAVSVFYGFGDIAGGRVVDSDWDGSGVQFSESRSDGRGDTSLFELGGEYLVAEQQGKSSLYIYIGYLDYRDGINITNGVQTLSDNIQVPPAGTILTGLNSTYEFRWECIKAGIEGKFERGRLTFGGDAYYLFLKTYRGEAFWNLRTDFRNQPPNFVQNADAGTGIDVNISASYEVVDSIKISGGYRYFSIKAENGRDIVYFSDGSRGITSLDRVEAKRQGPYISLEKQF